MYKFILKILNFMYDSYYNIACISQDDAVKPRALHRTTSVFLRNLAPAITKSELETVSDFYK